MPDSQPHPPEALPRVLVVSNNPLSATSNNGKTLASLFQEFPPGRVAQLYFAPDTPSGRDDFRYYRIDERELIRRPFATDPGGGDVAVSAAGRDAPSGRPSRLGGWARRSHLARLLREAVWIRRKVDGSTLGSWVDEVRPEVVFLCAGDSLFAYRMARQVVALTGARLAVFVTDDYVLPGRWRSPAGLVRRALVASRMRGAVRSADAFFTISPKMRAVYAQVFGRDSVVIGNATPPIGVEVVDTRHAGTALIYAGSLHSGRSAVLAKLVDALADLNADRPADEHGFLEIYTGTALTGRDRESLDRPPVSRLSPLLGPDEYARAMSRADIFVHIESFEPAQVAVTRLSLSTKIAEYLSVGKPILAIGPAAIASMEYLAPVAHCITNPEDLLPELVTLLDDAGLRRRLGTAALKQYRDHNAPNVVLEALYAGLRPNGSSGPASSQAPSSATDVVEGDVPTTRNQQEEKPRGRGSQHH